MSNLIKDLDQLLSDNNNVQKELNLELDNEMLTKAIDAILPYPGSHIDKLTPGDLLNNNCKFYIENIVILDIEFYTLINPNISQFGFAAYDKSNKIANLVREMSLLILERTYVNNSYYWAIKKLVFFNINNEFLYKALYFMRRNYATNNKNNIRGPYLQMLSQQFMTIDEEEYNLELNNKLKNNQIKNKEQFIDRLQKNVNQNINNENYLNYSYHKYYHADHNLSEYHDAIMNTYINNSGVKKREISAIQTLGIFKLLELYNKKICIVHKGSSDIKAINNSYRLFDWIDQYNYSNKKFISSVYSYNVNNKLKIRFKHIYNIDYFNGMSHVLYKSAKLNITCNRMIESKFYKQIIRNKNINNKSFQNLIFMLKSGKVHDPNYDVISALIVIIIIHLSTLIIFTE